MMIVERYCFIYNGDASCYFLIKQNDTAVGVCCHLISVRFRKLKM